MDHDVSGRSRSFHKARGAKLVSLEITSLETELVSRVSGSAGLSEANEPTRPSFEILIRFLYPLDGDRLAELDVPCKTLLLVQFASWSYRRA